VFIPYRKFVASPSWFAAGPLVHRALDDAPHEGIDPRTIDAVKAGAPLVYGWLRYSETGIAVVAEAEPGTPPDFEEWLQPLLRRWAESEKVVLDETWSPSDEWGPGA
jgi:hypothetical protein